MVTALITVAALAWICQMAFGGWQIHRFNRAFDALCQKGRVGVGRSGGRFKPRVVVLLRWMKTIRSAIPSSCAA
jgi:glucitol operon activator protein